ncbi:MAG TPA: hypothetical protein VGG91_00945 [Myxococcaceae bacterium]|jgi:hypothetical protein
MSAPPRRQCAAWAKVVDIAANDAAFVAELDALAVPASDLRRDLLATP